MIYAEPLQGLLIDDQEALSHLKACGPCRAEWARLQAQEGLLREHFGALQKKPLPLPAPRRRFLKPLAAAAAVLLALGGTWLLRPGGPPPAYGDIQVLKQGYTITVFNQGLGLVRDRRRILNLRPGINRFKLEEIPSGLIPDSVRFRSETDPEGCKVLEQNFEYDLADRDAVLRKYVDRQISFERTGTSDLKERLKGVLLSPDGEGIVRMGNGEVLSAFPGEPVLPGLPGGLLTRPALDWVLDAPKESRHETTVSYLTHGMEWHADYLLTLRDEKSLDLDGWVSITNESGATYADAGLKLLAGNVHLEMLEDCKKCEEELSDSSVSFDRTSFQEKAFGEYHLYTLQRPTTLRDQETKQVDLLGARGVPYREEYVYEHTRGETVLKALVFRNAQAAHLGMPLPAGTVRILALGSDGEAEQVALASIEHTPKDEEVRIPMGEALFLAAEHKSENRRMDAGVQEDDIEVRLRNHGDVPVRVKVLEHPNGGWTIQKASHPFTQPDAGTAAFEVDIPADGETLIRYTLRQAETKEEEP